jgi:hypothetical protein
MLLQWFADRMRAWTHAGIRTGKEDRDMRAARFHGFAHAGRLALGAALSAVMMFGAAAQAPIALADAKSDEIAAADAALAKAKAAEAAAKIKADLAAKTEKEGSKGFFDSIGATDASAIITQGQKNTQYGKSIRLGDPDSSTWLENMRSALIMLDEGNSIRASLKLPLWQVDWDEVAMAQLGADANTFSGAMGHFQGTYDGAQNLYWGSGSPYASWYDDEKAVYDAYDKAHPDEHIRSLNEMQLYRLHPDLFVQVGHYLNIIQPDMIAVGAANAIGGAYGYTSAQDFGGRTSGLVSIPDAIQSVTVYYYGLRKDLSDYADAQAATAKAQAADDAAHAVPVPVYRVYNRNSGLHHYTTNAKERDALVQLGWKNEGVSFNAAKQGSAPGLSPVYREYNPYNGTHNWTLSLAEHRKLVSVGWRDEGVAWYASYAGPVMVYRLYNPHSGEHVYTTGAAEYAAVGRAGWHQEGTAWKGL